MSEVYEQARALVKAIIDSDESRSMRRLGARVRNNEKLESLLAEFRRRQFEVQAAQFQGQEPSREQVDQIQKLAKRVEGEPVLREYLEAENAYGQMVLEVQKVLAEVFNPEVPGPVKLER